MACFDCFCGLFSPDAVAKRSERHGENPGVGPGRAEEPERQREATLPAHTEEGDLSLGEAERAAGAAGRPPPDDVKSVPISSPDEAEGRPCSTFGPSVSWATEGQTRRTARPEAQNFKVSSLDEAEGPPCSTFGPSVSWAMDGMTIKSARPEAECFNVFSPDEVEGPPCNTFGPSVSWAMEDQTSNSARREVHGPPCGTFDLKTWTVVDMATEAEGPPLRLVVEPATPSALPLRP